MAKPSRAKTVAVKVNEAQVAGWVAQTFGVPRFDTLAQVAERVVEESSGHHSVFSNEVELYPWVTNVPGGVMGDEVSELVGELLCSPDVLFIVRDSSLPGGKGLWVVQASSEKKGAFSDLDKNMPYRGLINHFKVGNKIVCVRAMQLESCVRYVS